DSIFQDNTANKKCGGAIYLVGEITLSNSTFKNNTCNVCGGAIYCLGGKGSVIDCTFINCNNSAYGSVEIPYFLHLK
ncbi:MAG: hypothetical protein MJ211_16335, partial [Bacteroidales bacterium]|nr:hypothetical protein [Bacteroidales bacterium]